MSHPEAELVRRCLAGDEEAVGLFVERYQSVIFGLCWRMLGHRQDAEDVTQEVLVRALRGLAGWKADYSLLPWIMTIASNRCRTWLSRRGGPGSRKVRPSELVEDVAAPEPHTQPDLAEELQLALEKVREEYRLCFVLFHVNGMTLEEIAQIVDAPEGTVKTWLFRVRRELAGHLRRRGIGLGVSHELQ